ncbi:MULTISPECIES: hypothetical protein [Staphylococcus]|uniref:Phage protein n=1 Tax=Staphylococcus muscae TaxID=1294 RepID=A0A240BU19_9STAP|nr:MULTISPECIES: hypothetical protein [Staphylococcus]UXR69855.1 hypothetical protein MUA26_01550 [Staphylococcus sp. IVB6246]UXR71894.1 hypothetical protein MUA88_01525 [Staphylococcus sp. IVB6240]UXR74201.1 hypothetical protein MUA48_01700 [Staphylococcus sp. IVB6238]UXR76590.1 hypothetical protein MUA74_02065 [Staphylococcus sp. IVB6233]UXR80718.1 hypothetical protein MUA65_01675 [Staphylococcus sp. IVB6218]
MNNSNYLVPAGLFIGIGLGSLFDQLLVGACLGLGIGLFIKSFVKDK